MSEKIENDSVSVDTNEDKHSLIGVVDALILLVGIVFVASIALLVPYILGR